MKIMFIPTGFPSDDNRATMLFVYEQAKALAAAGHEITVLHVQRQPSKALFKRIDPSIHVVEDGFCKRYFTRLKTFAMHKLPGLNRKLFVKKMKELFAYAISCGEKPDVLYAHFSCWAGCAAIEIGRENSIPVVTIEHYGGFVSGKRIEKAYINGLQYTVQNSEAMLCVSEKLKEAIQRITKTQKQITVIPNMVDDRFVYHEVPKHSDFKFCTLGHLNPGKRISMLAEAFCEAFSSDDNVTLTIGGDGIERKKIEKIIKDNDRKRQITMLGRLSREQTEKLYTESDCFVLPSAWETFGLVYREAMGIGRPIITTNHGGWDETNWSDDFGIMIKIDDKAELIEALKSMRNRFDSYNLKRIAAFVQDTYSCKAIVTQIETVLTNVVEGYHER